MIKSASQSSLTNDVKYRNMGAANVPSNEYLIETVIVPAGGLASITFNNLSQWAGIYKHLQICYVARTDQSSDIGTVYIRFNGDSGTNYSRHFLYGDSGAGSPQSFGEANTNHAVGSLYARSGFATGAFGSGTIDILDAYGAKNKTVRSLGGIASKQVSLTSSNWRNTGAITSIQILTEGFTGNYVQGSRFSLYGVTA